VRRVLFLPLPLHLTPGSEISLQKKIVLVYEFHAFFMSLFIEYITFPELYIDESLCRVIALLVPLAGNTRPLTGYFRFALSRATFGSPSHGLLSVRLSKALIASQWLLSIRPVAGNHSNRPLTGNSLMALSWVTSDNHNQMIIIIKCPSGQVLFSTTQFGNQITHTVHTTNSHRN
jgi:hypothetical protein